MNRAFLRLPIAARLVGLPPLVLGILAVGLLLLAAFGVHPLWPRSGLTLSEAAALADDGAIVRLVLAGADPNTRGSVRPGLLGSTELRLAPLEAAVASREERTLRTLLKYGATVEGDAGRSAVCIAHHKAPHLLATLQAHGAIVVDPSGCLEEGW